MFTEKIYRSSCLKTKIDKVSDSIRNCWGFVSEFLKKLVSSYQEDVLLDQEERMNQGDEALNRIVHQSIDDREYQPVSYSVNISESSFIETTFSR